MSTGASSVLLGDTSGNLNATLGFLEGQSFDTSSGTNRGITVQAGNTGVSTIAIIPALGSNATNYVTGYNNGDTQIQSTGGILLNNNLTLQTIANSRLVFGNGNATVISGTGNLTVTGPGIVYLDNNTSNGANSFNGNITVNQGTLQINNDDAMGTGNVSSTITFAAGTAWRMDGGSNGRTGGNDTRNYVINGLGVVWSRNGGNSFNITGTITDNGNGLSIMGGAGAGYAARKTTTISPSPPIRPPP